MKISLKTLIQKGLLHIVSASVLNKIIQFCSSILLVRFFSQETYGQWSYANTILNFFLLFEGLGVASSLLQFVGEKHDSEQRYKFFKFALKVGCIVGFCILICIFLVSTYGNLSISGSKEILKWLLAIPIFTSFFNIVESYFRATLDNKSYSLLSVIYTASSSVFMIIGVLLYDVYGVIIARYVAWLLTDLLCVFFLRRDITKIIYSPKLNKNEKKEFMGYAVSCALANSISSLLYLIDTFLIGLLIADSVVVAIYKTATLIPFALDFIPLALVTFVYPYFAREIANKDKVRQYYLLFIKYICVLNFFISAILFIFAPLIIQIFFGNTYSDAVIPFRILSIGYFFAGTFRIPAGNVLSALRKVNINLLVAIASGLLNIILNILLIKLWGAVGAAVSTLIIFVLTGLFYNFYLWKILKK